MADAPSFFEGPVGLTYAEEHVVCMKITGETVAWVPPGMLAVPVAVEEQERGR